MKLISLEKEIIDENSFWKERFEEKYNFKFKKTKYLFVPHASSRFEDEEIVRKITDIDQYLLNGHIVNMKTNSHREMNKLRYQFTTKEYKWFQNINKLGLNRFGAIGGIVIETLQKSLKREDLVLDKKIEKEFKKYINFSFEEKIKLVNTVDEELYKILEKIYEEPLNIKETLKLILKL